MWRLGLKEDQEDKKELKRLQDECEKALKKLVEEVGDNKLQKFIKKVPLLHKVIMQVPYEVTIQEINEVIN